EVVPCNRALAHELRVAELEEFRVPEACDVRVEDLRVDPVLVHALEALVGIPGRRVGLLEGRWVAGAPFLPAGHGAVRDRYGRLVVEHPDGLAGLGVRSDVRDLVTPLRLGEPRRPDVWRLHNV